MLALLDPVAKIGLGIAQAIALLDNHVQMDTVCRDGTFHTSEDRMETRGIMIGGEPSQRA